VRATTDILANVLNLDVSTFGKFRGSGPVVGGGQGWNFSGNNTVWTFAPQGSGSTTFPPNSYVLGLYANQTCGTFYIPQNTPIPVPYGCLITHPSINVNTSFMMLSPSNNLLEQADSGYVPLCSPGPLLRPVTVNGLTFTNAFYISVTAANYDRVAGKSFSFLMNFQFM
jgi:hypothetical protein